MDIAELGIRVDSNGSVKAITDLDKLTKSSSRAENGVERLGATSTRTSQQVRNTAIAANQAGMAMRMQAGSGRMLTQQLSQVAQQATVTGNVTHAMASQMADIGLAFGTVGTVVGAVAGIALPALVSSFADSGGEAEKLTETMDALGEAVDRFRDAVDESRVSAMDMFEQFGSADPLIRQVLVDLAALEKIDAFNALEDGVTELTGSFSGLAGELGEITEFFGGNLSPILSFSSTNSEIIDTSKEFQKFLGQLEAATTISERLQAAVSLRSILIDNTGGIAQMNDEQRNFLRQLNKAIQQMAILRDTAGETATETGNIVTAAYNSAEAFAAILPPVDSLLAKVQDTAAAAWDMVEALASAPGPSSGFAGGRGGDPTTMGGSLSDWNDPRNRLIINPGDTPDKPASRSGGRSGGGGGGISEEQRLHNERLQEAERIFDDTRMAAEKYGTELSDLSELHKLGYLDGETYARAIAQVGEEFEQVQFDYLLQGIEDISDAMADAIINGQNMGEALGQVFAQIAQDLISSGLEQLIKQTFGFGGSFGLSILGGGLPSFDGGGYTGDGARAGGLDGKGGYLAMLHPQETVVDHTGTAIRAAMAPAPAPASGVDTDRIVTAINDNQSSVKVVNVLDPRIVGQYLDTPEGEQAIVNVMQRTGHVR